MVLTIGLDEKTSQDLEQIAKIRAVEPVILAREAIRSFLRAETRRAIEQEANAFRRLHSELLSTIPGEFAAICKGQLVDHDVDQLVLFQRIEAVYPGEPVLIRQVRSEIEQIIDVRSPRLEYD